jgi:hypothetical protein
MGPEMITELGEGNLVADIWVLGTSMHKDKSGPLVRADAITHLLASTEKVTASQIGSDDVITLVHQDSVGHGYRGAHPVPDHFHLALLRKFTEARKQVQGSEEDLIVFADLDDNEQWEWAVFPVSEIWTD